MNNHKNNKDSLTNDVMQRGGEKDKNLKSQSDKSQSSDKSNKRDSN